MNRTFPIVMISLLFLLGSTTLLSAEQLFKNTDHCVAYRTTKKMFFLFTVKVVGKSCDFQAKLDWSKDGKDIRLLLVLHTDKFESGINKRDRHITEILGGNSNQDIRLDTGWIKADYVMESANDKPIKIPAVLGVGGRKFPIKVNVKVERNGFVTIASGVIKTLFSNLQVKVPPVGPAGIIAQPSDQLDLLLHLRLDKIQGIDRIIALKNK